MSQIDDKLKEISDRINEHIIAVKGTLEVVDTSRGWTAYSNCLMKCLLS